MGMGTSTDVSLWSDGCKGYTVGVFPVYFFLARTETNFLCKRREVLKRSERGGWGEKAVRMAEGTVLRS